MNTLTLETMQGFLEAIAKARGVCRMTSPTPAPAPLAYTPYDYTRQGILEAWTREKMRQMLGKKPEPEKGSE